MLGQLVVIRVNVRFVARRLRNADAKIVWHPQLNAATKEIQRAYMAADPVRQFLSPSRFEIYVIRSAQHGDEHLGIPDLDGAAFDDIDGLGGLFLSTTHF